MDPALQTYATRAVPRFTSYPTAPHFSDAVTADDYAGWLAALDPDEPVSLYLHVPFCRELCWYCGCNMKLARSDAPINHYVDVLKQEIRMVASRLPGRFTIGHLHWGGGTPTTLSPGALESVMAAIADRFDFTPQAELAIESDPRTLSAEMIARIGALGFTRASFGVQEFDPQVQAAINRIQPPEMVRRAVDGLRDAGVGGINFDLIYGLPHQTVETLVGTVRLCASMRPDRLALFGYAHVPWMAKRQRLIDEAALPGTAARMTQAQAAEAALTDAGYEAVGLDHFALPGDALAIAAWNGTLRRNFQGYTTDRADTLLGLGATAIGRTSQGYVQNISETGAWEKTVSEGRLPVARGRAITAEDAVRAAVIESLMCYGRVDLAAVTARFPVAPDWYRDCDAELAELVAAGAILRDGPVIALTEEGRPLVRVVAAVFDACYTARKARHSVAV